MGIAIVALGSGVAAASGVFVATHTGRYAGAMEIANGGPGELLDVQGTRFDQIAARLAAGIPFPPGGEAWRRRVLVADASVARSSVPCPVSSTRRCDVVASTGSLRGEFAMSAFCAWISDWRHAVATGDRAAAETAARQIAGAPKWRAIVTDDPSVADGSTAGLFGWIVPYVAAVRGGKAGSVDRLITDNVGEGACGWLDPRFLAYAESVGYPRNGQAASPIAYDRFIRGGGR